MFGYIGIDKPEMRIKDFQTFQGYYCGLCRTIAEKYGNLPRFLLSYDCAFLYLLLASLHAEPEQRYAKRCPVSPFKKKPYVKDRWAAYAAAVNVLLGVQNLLDKKKDAKSIAGGAAACALAGAYKKAKAAYPETAESIEKNLALLQKEEQAGEADLDKAADAFARLLGEVFAGAGLQTRILYELGYHIGRWIFFIDAFDDRERDRKKGTYNPFIKKFGNREEEAKKSADFNLKSAVHGAVLAYDLLDIEKHKEILDNILYRGLAKRTTQVLNKEKKRGSDGSV